MKSGLMPITRGEPLQARHLKIDLSDEQRQECLKILKIFGSSGAYAETISELGPTRASFADCSLSEKSREERRTLFEIKSETAIDRIKGTAKSGSLRFIERVPADIAFDFSICLKILGKDDDDLLDYLLNGLKLLEMDALGGSGSRGYGKIRFEFVDEIIREKFESLNPFENGV